MTVLVTGAGGFVGNALVELLRQHTDVRAAVRREDGSPAAASRIAVGDIGPDTDWRAALAGADTVVHLAARVHVMRDEAADPLAAYRHTNVEGTRRLAQMAATAGVRRFVLLSSAKVHGETSERPFQESDPLRPEDPYAISKLEAERALQAACSGTSMEWVILRPPLVYGAGVRANFLALLRAVARGIPLPLAAIHNRRSLMYIGNLVAAVAACVGDPRAAHQTFLLSDGEDLSSPDLVRGLAQAMGRRARLLPIPVALLRVAATVAGRAAQLERLAGSLQVDPSRLRAALGFMPPFSVSAGLKETARWYLATLEKAR